MKSRPPALTAALADVLIDARDRHATAMPGEKGRIVEALAETLGCSKQTAHKKLEMVGHSTERKQRSDARASALSDRELMVIAGALAASQNNKGQRMPVDTALDMLHASGQLTTRVHASTVSRQLSARHMHPKQLAQPTPSQQMVSLHPNHVWQVDSTTGAYYYLPGGRLRWMPEDEFYKNKVENLVKASSDLLTRYACVDHTSHAFKCRYYLGGETVENLLHFVTWAMCKQDRSPMHGVPRMLLMDPGGANKSGPMRNLARSAGFVVKTHEAGNARATGSVEKVHDLVRMHFETRFRFLDRREVTLEALNEHIDLWAAAYCSTRRHTRHRSTRFDVWMAITADQLRVPASLEALREGAVREPEQRRVENNRRVRFDGRVYDLSIVPGAVPGLKVTLQVNVFRSPDIDVQFVCPETGEESWHVVSPIKVDKWGFQEGGPVWGQDMRAAANSVVDDNRNRLLKAAYKVGDGLPTLDEAKAARKAHAQAFAGVVDPMADVKATPVPAFLPRRATELPLPQRQVEARRLTHVEAAQALLHQLGDAYRPQVYTHLVNTYPGGVPEPELSAIADLFRANGESLANRANLASGGGAL